MHINIIKKYKNHKNIINTNLGILPPLVIEVRMDGKE